MNTSELLGAAPEVATWCLDNEVSPGHLVENLPKPLRCVRRIQHQPSPDDRSPQRLQVESTRERAENPNHLVLDGREFVHPPPKGVTIL